MLLKLFEIRQINPNIVIAGVIILMQWAIPASIMSQELPQSQYYNNMVHLNPGYAGVLGEMRLNLFHRTQWLGYGTGFHFSGVAFDAPIAGKNSGWGIKVTNDINGTIITPSIDAIYSYRFRLTPKIAISLGLQAGVVQKFQNLGGLNFGDTEEPNLPSGFKKIYPGFAIGGVMFRKNLYGGISLDHLTRPFQGTLHNAAGRQPIIAQASIGYIKYYPASLIDQTRAISPNLIYTLQGFASTLTWGANYQYDILTGGIWLRHNLQPKINSLIFSLGYKTKTSRFTYSYDISLGMKSVKPGATHEISYTQLFNVKPKKKPKPIECPSFLL